MKLIKHITIIMAICIGLVPYTVNGQERVYVSTDKNCYLAGEDIWLSLFCIDGKKGEYSDLSKLAYIELHSREGVQTTVKVALKDGRGAGRLKIPFNFPTGNYSLVAFTSVDGGASAGEFNGKVITVFNTLTAEKVEGGVVAVDKDEPVKGDGVEFGSTAGMQINVAEAGNEKGKRQVRVVNSTGGAASLNVSVYHLDKLNALVGANGYNSARLLSRRGDFEPFRVVDYSGETINVKVTGKSGKGEAAANEVVYMSALGNTDDVYAGMTDENGVVTFYTNNIYGNRDMVFEVGKDTARSYNVEILQEKGEHRPAAIPVLRISSKMKEALQERNLNMQIAARFEADTIYDLMPMRGTSFIGQVVPYVYDLDDYTRFPVMREVVAEYVKYLRIRKDDNQEVFKVLWNDPLTPLLLLDGVPLQDHSVAINMDPLLVKRIEIYPRKYVLNAFIYSGVVKFITYKGDMAGVNLGNNVNIQSFRGASYPLAFFGEKVYGKEKYPNFNNTIYWNPVVELNNGESFNFECVLPGYKGEFKVVVEGMGSGGKEIYCVKTFKVE